MSVPFASSLPAWLELFVVLGGGGCLIAAAAALAVRWIGAAQWQRAVWQAAVLGMIALAVVEWTGVGRATVQMAVRPWSGGAGGARSVPLDSPSAAVGVPDVSLAAARAGSSARGVERIWANHERPEAEFAAASLPGAPAERAEADEQAGESPAALAGGLWTWWPALIWAVGAGVLFLGILRDGVVLRRFRRGCAPVEDAAALRAVASLGARLGLRRGADLYESDVLAAPVAFGLLRPAVVVPAGMFRGADRRRQEAVLAHELAHLAAGDPLWQLLARVACAAWWWHPAAWWTSRRLRAANETAADEASLLVPEGPTLLADCLVSLARRLARRRQLAWLGAEGSGFRSGLGRRVERLLTLPETGWRGARRSRLLLGRLVFPWVLVASVVFSTAWARTQAPSWEEGGTTMSVLKNSWRQSVVAAVLVAIAAPLWADDAADKPHGEGAVVAKADGEREKETPRKDAPDKEHAEAREKKEGDAPRKEVPDKEHAEAREKKEGDAPRKEAPDKERPEAREKKEGDRHEAELREQKAKEREALMRVRQELEERAREIRAKIAQLRPDQEAAARELKAEFEKIQARMRELAGAPEKPDRPGPQREEVMRRIEEIKRRVEELKAAGQTEQAERLIQEGRKLMEMLQHGPAPDRPMTDREAAERHLRELRAKVEQLVREGKHDAAEQVERQMQELRRRLEAAAHPERPDAPPRPEGPPRPANEREQLERVIREMRGQMEEMRREMEGLRQEIRRLHAERERAGAR